MKAGNEKSRNFSGLISPYRGFINAGQSASLALGWESLVWFSSPIPFPNPFFKGSQVRIPFFKSKRRVSLFASKKLPNQKPTSNLGGKGHKRGMKLLIGSGTSPRNEVRSMYVGRHLLLELGVTASNEARQFNEAVARFSDSKLFLSSFY